MSDVNISINLHVPHTVLWLKVKLKRNFNVMPIMEDILTFKKYFTYV